MRRLVLKADTLPDVVDDDKLDGDNKLSCRLLPTAKRRKKRDKRERIIAESGLCLPRARRRG